jgi:AraC-like DNA-binding protein
MLLYFFNFLNILPVDFFAPNDYGPVTTCHEVPAKYRQYRILAAQPCYTEGNFFNYLTQIITSRGCSAQLNLIHMVDDCCLQPYTVDSIIPLHFTLMGNIRCMLEGFGEAWLLEKRFHLFYVPGGKRHHAWFKPGSHISFHIDFSPEYLQWLATQYPEIADVSKRTTQRSTAGVQQHAAYITPSIRKIVNEIITGCPTEEPEKSLFMEVKSKELLLKYVQDIPVDKELLSQGEISRLDAMIAYVTAHLDHPHTIESLSEQSGMSKTILKRKFKEYTGQGIHGYIMERRLTEAMRLITDTTLPVYDIAVQTGYYTFSSFDRAFLHRFGHSPAYYRR